MKIAFDAKRAFNNLSGLGNYSRSVIKNIAQESPNSHIYLFTPKITQRFIFTNHNINIIKPNQWSNEYYWRLIGIKQKIRDLKIDIYHGLSNETPYNIQIKNIVTIHDLLFIKYPYFYSRIDRYIYYIKSKKACQNATKIIATSQSTKEDIVEYLNINPNKIQVVYQSCHQDFIDCKEHNVSKEIKDIIKKPYILFVGRIEERKNLKTLIQSLSKLNEVNLICVGKKTKYYKKIKILIQNLKIEKRVSFIDFIDNVSLSFLYKNSRALVYPSIDEGFGIPIIEAMYSSTPVVISNKKIFKEIGGQYSYYFEQNNIESLIEAIKSIWYDSNERENQIIQNLKYVQKFNENRQAREIINLYKGII